MNFKLAVELDRFVVGCPWPRVLYILTRVWKWVNCGCMPWVLSRSRQKYRGVEQNINDARQFLPFYMDHGSILWVHRQGPLSEDVGKVEEESWREGEPQDCTYRELTSLNPWTWWWKKKIAWEIFVILVIKLSQDTTSLHLLRLCLILVYQHWVKIWFKLLCRHYSPW